MYYMKYIITDQNEIKMGGSFHQDMGDECKGRVIIAGHCSMNPDGTYRVWGSSIGYGIDAQTEDAELIRKLLTG
jgi:hypothetical protein